MHDHVRAPIARKLPVPGNRPRQTTLSGEPSVSTALQRAQDRPDSLTPDDVMELQRTVGNQTVQRLLAGRTKSRQAQEMVPVKNPLLMQSKLTVGPASDQYEQEADRIADQVVGRIG